MKNQYFGDENDYRKYGLLRVLTNRGSLGTGICWLLTDPDSRNDGGRISYLTMPSTWQQHDPNLYDALVQIVRVDRCRDVARANDPSILRGMIFQSSIVDAPAKSHMVLAANGGHLVHSGADAMNQRRTIDRKAA